MTKLNNVQYLHIDGAQKHISLLLQEDNGTIEPKDNTKDVYLERFPDGIKKWYQKSTVASSCQTSTSAKVLSPSPHENNATFLDIQKIYSEAKYSIARIKQKVADRKINSKDSAQQSRRYPDLNAVHKHTRAHIAKL